MPRDFPNIALSRDQLLRLQEAVIDRIVERKDKVTWLSESLARVQAPDGIGLK
jgi:hypothetical protein